ncbi:MAG: hypothetical protein JY451_07270 [Erythrobacter sp.]|nr:MAG: hypothetical protein JY451_07270 [Erythrobacter sp.]
MNVPTLAIAALFPAIVGPLPLAGPAPLMLEMAMCNGGMLSIPIERNGPAVPATTPCCAKGCQSRKRGKAFDAGQGH